MNQAVEDDLPPIPTVTVATADPRGPTTEELGAGLKPAGEGRSSQQATGSGRPAVADDVPLKPFSDAEIVVASGRQGDTEWTVRVHRDADRRLCIRLYLMSTTTGSQRTGEIGGGCHYQLPLDQFEMRSGLAHVVAGPVTRAASTVRVEKSDGVTEATILVSPPDLPNNYYVLFVDPEAIVDHTLALDGAEHVIARHQPQNGL